MIEEIANYHHKLWNVLLRRNKKCDQSAARLCARRLAEITAKIANASNERPISTSHAFCCVSESLDLGSNRGRKCTGRTRCVASRLLEDHSDVASVMCQVSGAN
jgi:hypothetical protein